MACRRAPSQRKCAGYGRSSARRRTFLAPPPRSEGPSHFLCHPEPSGEGSRLSFAQAKALQPGLVPVNHVISSLPRDLRLPDRGGTTCIHVARDYLRPMRSLSTRSLDKLEMTRWSSGGGGNTALWGTSRSDVSRSLSASGLGITPAADDIPHLSCWRARSFDGRQLRHLGWVQSSVLQPTPRTVKGPRRLIAVALLLPPC